MNTDPTTSDPLRMFEERRNRIDHQAFVDSLECAPSVGHIDPETRELNVYMYARDFAVQAIKAWDSKEWNEAIEEAARIYEHAKAHDFTNDVAAEIRGLKR